MELAIDPSFKVLSRGPSPEPVGIERVTVLGVSQQYLDLVEGGADLELEHQSGLDVRIWSPDWVIEMNDVHDVLARVGGLAIGDADGLFLVERPDGLFAVGPGALDPDELRPVCADLAELLGGRIGELG